MKKIINGKKYNIETAEPVGHWHNGCVLSDFNCCAETLYKKKTGEYFLHGEGHARSKYASRSGDCSGWGEEIIPITDKEAKDWCMEHLGVDEFEKMWGEVAE